MFLASDLLIIIVEPKTSTIIGQLSGAIFCSLISSPGMNPIDNNLFDNSLSKRKSIIADSPFFKSFKVLTQIIFFLE